MTAKEAIDLVEHCIDLLGQIETDDEVHRDFAVNQIREKLWEVRNKLAGEDDVAPSQNLTTRAARQRAMQQAAAVPPLGNDYTPLSVEIGDETGMTQQEVMDHVDSVCETLGMDRVQVLRRMLRLSKEMTEKHPFTSARIRILKEKLFQILKEEINPKFARVW